MAYLGCEIIHTANVHNRLMYHTHIISKCIYMYNLHITHAEFKCEKGLHYFLLDTTHKFNKFLIPIPNNISNDTFKSVEC